MIDGQKLKLEKNGDLVKAATLVAKLMLFAVPDETGLFFGDFEFETNNGTTDMGRFADAFTASSKSSFDGFRSLANQD